jgi:hypothetical protein
VDHVLGRWRNYLASCQSFVLYVGRCDRSSGWVVMNRGAGVLDYAVLIILIIVLGALLRACFG